MTFVEDVLAGRATVDDAEFYRAAWGDSEKDLGHYHEYLGLLWPEYAMYVEEDDVLQHVIEARRAGQDLRTYLAPLRDRDSTMAELWRLVERYEREWAEVKP